MIALAWEHSSQQLHGGLLYPLLVVDTVNTIALVGGILAWIAFLIQIRTRVDELCVTYSSCNPGETAPLIVRPDHAALCIHKR